MSDSTLSDAQKAEFARQWRDYGLTLEQGLKLRRRARSDLFFLCNELLGKTLAECHHEVCDFFIHKDADAVDFDSFARNYDYPHVDGWGRICRRSHESLLWLMRSGLKSAIDICDKVQWIICFPDIRIRILTDVLSLSQQFVGAVVGYFTLKANGDPQEINGQPSLFQILFPEFCDARRAEWTGNVTPAWTTPARQNRLLLAPTIVAGSLEAGKTGSHCDVLVFDDSITPENMGKTEKSALTNLNNINHRISITLRLLDHPGFTEFIGTPQHPLDYLAQKVTAEEQRRDSGAPPQCRVLIRPCYTALPGHEGKTPDKLTKDDVQEWWPDRMPFEEVQRLWKEPGGRDTVATQLLLDVKLKQTVKFSEAALKSATIPWNRIPGTGTIVMSGDLAYSTKPRADFTCLGTAVIYDARFYVKAVKRGKFAPQDMAKEIALEIFKQRPDRIAIEDSQGAQWLHNDIQYELAKLGYSGAAIEWVGIGQGKWRKIELDADQVVKMFGVLRMLLSTGIEKIEDVYAELVAFPSPKHHDDIVAMLNQMAKHFLSEAELLIAESESAARSQIWDEQVHGYGAGSVRVDPELANLLSMELPE